MSCLGRMRENTSGPAMLPDEATRKQLEANGPALLDPDVMALQLAMDTLWAADTDHEELMAGRDADP